MNPTQITAIVAPIVTGVAALILPHLSSGTVAVIGSASLIVLTVAKAVHNVFVPTPASTRAPTGTNEVAK